MLNGKNAVATARLGARIISGVREESMWARTRGVLRALAERWALPQRCLFCGADRPARRHLRPVPGRSCPEVAPRAARPAAISLRSGEICGECLAHPPRFSRLSVAVSYRFPVDGAIQRLKYGADLSTGRAAGRAIGRSRRRANRARI